MNIEQIRQVLIGGRGVWSASPWSYSLLRFFRLDPDGTGDLIYGAGQTIIANITWTWDVPTECVLRVSYQDFKRLHPRCGSPPPQSDRHRDLVFQLDACDEEYRDAVNPTMFRYLWKLTFDEPPWPKELQFPHDVPTIFYGHRKDPVASTDEAN